MIRDHVAEAQLPFAAEHELEPFSHQFVRHEEAGRIAICLPLSWCAWCLNWAAVECAVAVHDGIFVQHEVAYFMSASKELNFVTKLGRNGDLVSLTIDQASDSGTSVVPVELGISQRGVDMKVIAADQGSDLGAAHHHWLGVLIWPEVSAITVDLHEQISRCFLDISFVHGKTPDMGSEG